MYEIVNWPFFPLLDHFLCIFQSSLIVPHRSILGVLRLSLGHISVWSLSDYFTALCRRRFHSFVNGKLDSTFLTELSNLLCKRTRVVTGDYGISR